MHLRAALSGSSGCGSTSASLGANHTYHPGKLERSIESCGLSICKNLLGICEFSHSKEVSLFGEEFQGSHSRKLDTQFDFGKAFYYCVPIP
ncbi:hypothetical protein CROQUDRAFT_652914 [Cronartium quercuum f. sp. fusiforme G11]|uniref:Uncharacterized protein n=1 Tax=Cronartium quercuum f. sp. fusiforme G11 TaxID=708437 RepID=A0A9P6NQR4_9BASI|nr:hypothetical protein CROQUDRAFT_652914 [Cronartium quercuum f. sp. fusiforme G11]